MNPVLIILSVIGGFIALYIIYALIFHIGNYIIGYKDEFKTKTEEIEEKPKLKVYKSNKSKCFSCEKQDPNSFQTSCLSCNQDLTYPDQNNTPGRYLQR